MHPNTRAAHEAGVWRAFSAPFGLLQAATVGVLALALPFAFPPAMVLTWMAPPMVVLLGWYVLPSIGSRVDARRLLIVPAVLAAALGYAWGAWRVGQVLDARVPQCADATFRQFDLHVLGPLQREVVGEDRTVARFNARVVIPPDPDCPGLGRHRVRLSWYDPPALAVGQHWRAEGRLRPPWGYRNPAGFDYERWLLGQRLGGNGYLRGGSLTRPSEGGAWPTDRLREAARRWVHGQEPRWGAIILALMIGDDSGITAGDWQALRDSGTVHLLVVSGLHVGMIAGILFQAGRWLARLCPPLLLALGSYRVGMVLALTGSAGYVWLSGAGVPAVRAWLMTAMLLAVVGSGRRLRARRVFWIVLATVVLADPLVVHQQGFWLSFGAVLSLIAFFEPRRSPRSGQRVGRWLHPLRTLVQVQLVLFVALSPLLALDQAGIPAAGPLVNTLVVPVVTLAVLPLVLVTGLSALLLPEAARWLLARTDDLLGLVMTGVGTGADAPRIAVNVLPLEWLVLGALMLMLVQAPSRWRLGMLLGLWLAVLMPDDPQPSHGSVRVTALDVGQGSAVLFDTNRHRLLFDTGAAFPSGFDLGEAVVLPSFRRGRRQHLNALVLSHDDIDHTGGAAAVIRSLVPDSVFSSFPWNDASTPIASRRCRQDLAWTWDGVRFAFLHPTPGWRGSDNDRSCVLMVTSASGARVVIGGDISARVERRLPKQPVDLAFAPHHGSATSSSASFVRGFRPPVVFVSTDRRSRYGHPHPDVLARYEEARVYVTGRSGALRWESDHPGSVVEHRRTAGAYWHGIWVPDPPSVGRDAARRAAVAQVSRAGAAGCPADG